MNQRDVYKLLEGLTSKNFKNELSLLKALVRDIVNHKDFEIVGGRIWELVPNESAYSLQYQFGNVEKIPEGYSVSINDQPVLKQLSEHRALLNYETDEVLKEKGIKIYSVAGVGETIKLKTGKYPKYALGFNAPEFLQSFFETLSIISSVATVALRNLSAQAEQKKIRRDLIEAAAIQRNLFPEHRLKFHDFDIFGVCIPDSAVGGDYFDYLKSFDDQDERIGLIISDAASKGLPAAIQSLFLSGAIRMGMGYSPRISNLLSRLNTLIYDTFPYERFVTLVYCQLTLSSNRLVLYANAGHCPPIHYSAADKSISFLGPTGGLLGLVQNQKFGVENFNMNPNDILVLYTDGITEATDESNKLFGDDRLCNIIKNNADKTAEMIAYTIIEEVQKYSALSDDNDDKTLIVVKRNMV